MQNLKRVLAAVVATHPAKLSDYTLEQSAIEVILCGIITADRQTLGDWSKLTSIELAGITPKHINSKLRGILDEHKVLRFFNGEESLVIYPPTSEEDSAEQGSKRQKIECSTTGQVVVDDQKE